MKDILFGGSQVYTIAPSQPTHGGRKKKREQNRVFEEIKKYYNQTRTSQMSSLFYNNNNIEYLNLYYSHGYVLPVCIKVRGCSVDR